MIAHQAHQVVQAFLVHLVQEETQDPKVFEELLVTRVNAGMKVQTGLKVRKEVSEKKVQLVKKELLAHQGRLGHAENQEKLALLVKKVNLAMLVEMGEMA
uniref:Uncharacterized protein n=1 Tax=Photinus pyralis TaxID=7054 RepID=A0A1Y1L7X7_PHOPY